MRAAWIVKAKAPKVDFGPTDQEVLEAARFVKNPSAYDGVADAAALERAEVILMQDKLRKIAVLCREYNIEVVEKHFVMLLCMALASEFVPGFDPLQSGLGRPLKVNKIGSPDLAVKVHRIKQSRGLRFDKQALEYLRKTDPQYKGTPLPTMQARHSRVKKLYDADRGGIVCPRCDTAFGEDWRPLGEHPSVKQT